MRIECMGNGMKVGKKLLILWVEEEMKSNRTGDSKSEEVLDCLV